MFAWVVLLVGCPLLQRQGNGRDPASRYVSEGERFFQQRADRQKLDSAISSWQAGLLEAPGDPVLLGRLSMAYTVRADIDPAYRPAGYITAREFGIQCLQTDPYLAGVMQTYGGRLVPRALRTLKAERVDCLTWTSIAWGRWLYLHGVAGASLDLEIITALAQKAVELDASFDRGRPMHALGLALSLPPAPLSPDLVSAQEALESALDSAPERWVIKVDLAERIYGPKGQGERFNSALSDVVGRTTSTSPQEALENQAALEYAAEALQRGPHPTWGP